MSEKFQQQRRFLLKAIAASMLVPRIVLGNTVTNPDVVIIGAGVAGIEAAKTLHDKGISFVVVEANYRIGGRVHTNNSIFGVPFDTHAHWMMISRKNPLINYAKDNGFNIYEDLDKQKYFVGNREATEDELADLRRTDKAFNNKIRDSVLNGVAGDDDNARTALGEDFFQSPWGYTVASDYGVWNMAENSKDWSPKDWWNSIGGDDWFCAEGYGSVVAHYGQDVPVALATAVKEINWQGDGVKVVTWQAGTIKAKAAILTVSVGVLAANHIKFTPELPVEKQEAIDGIDMAVMNYIGLHFTDDVFNFGADTYVYKQQHDEDGVGYLANLNNTNLVYGYVGGDQAKALEKETIDTAIAYGLDGMKSMLGNDIEKKFIKGYATACGQIPFYEGAYSAAKPGKQPMRAVLRETLADKLFFSGEATHRVQWGSVNGGLYSGRESANQAARYIKRKWGGLWRDRPGLWSDA